MNQNALIAVLVVKGIISKEEGEKIVEYLNNKPQSTMLSEVLNDISEFVTEVKQEVGKLASKSKSAGKEAVDAAKNMAGETEKEIESDIAAIDEEEKALEQGASTATNTPETAKVQNSQPTGSQK